MAMRNRVQLLAEDIRDTTDDNNQYEVIDGELYLTPPPDLAHQHVVVILSRRIGSSVEDRNLGFVYVAPLGVILERGSGVQPDLVFVSHQRAGIMFDRGLDGAPDLVGEVLSPSTASRDRGIKMRRYAASGIEHYWIVDPRGRTLEAYRLGSSGYDLVTSLGHDAVIEPELFPGLAIKLADLWLPAGGSVTTR